MKKKIALFVLLFLPCLAYAQADIEDHFNLCLEFGAPLEVVQLFQPFRTYKAETNGTISYVTKEDAALLEGRPYTEYQIWYTIDKAEGLYQSSLVIRGERADLQHILTSYLRKFSGLYGEAVYTNLNNGSLLAFWFNETNYTVKARLILDIDNPYKFVSITYCSPLPRHGRLLTTLYNGNVENGPGVIEPEQIPKNEESKTPSAGSFEQAGSGTLPNQMLSGNSSSSFPE
ncbi:MAG: hypothetical protein LBH43_09855 [Treponema sp.]|jgi:hypothetical protein|nr:hypothetical protein [Treponema sp.]